jgi:hypothetical protein
MDIVSLLDMKMVGLCGVYLESLELQVLVPIEIFPSKTKKAGCVASKKLLGLEEGQIF